MSAQQDLFSTTKPPQPVSNGWYSGKIPRHWREGCAKYVHIIRAEDDPERLSREERKRLGTRDPFPHHTIDKASVQLWRDRIQHLFEELPSELRERGITFNRVSVLLADVTADVAAFTKLDAAMFSLVESKFFEMSLEAPILFRPIR